jgi:hypothetical protein
LAAPSQEQADQQGANREFFQVLVRGNERFELIAHGSLLWKYLKIDR